MRLLIGVHLKNSFHKDKDFLHFLEKNFAADPKTFFVLFDWPSFSKAELGSLSKETGVPRKRFFLVKTHEGKDNAWSGRFDRYSTNFNRLMNLFSKKLQPKEKVSVISFGGSATGCYKKISGPMLQALSKRFGKRLTNVQTALPFVYDRPKTTETQPKTWFLRIKKMLRRRKRT